MKLKRLAAEQRQCLKSLSDLFIIFFAVLSCSNSFVFQNALKKKTFVYLSKLIDVTSTISYANPFHEVTWYNLV